MSHTVSSYQSILTVSLSLPLIIGTLSQANHTVVKMFTEHGVPFAAIEGMRYFKQSGMEMNFLPMVSPTVSPVYTLQPPTRTHFPQTLRYLNDISILRRGVVCGCVFVCVAWFHLLNKVYTLWHTGTGYWLLAVGCWLLARG